MPSDSVVIMGGSDIVSTTSIFNKVSHSYLVLRDEKSMLCMKTKDLKIN